MLSYLKITNYALIETCEIDFSGGFTVVTGESGAGKSIVMSAIEQLCGGRGGKAAIRTGCERCTVSGIFTIPPELQPVLRKILEDGGVELPADFTELNLRRIFTASSSRNFIEDTPVSTKLLARCGELLVDRHSANEQISLTLPSRQLELLDNYANSTPLKQRCADLCAELSALEEKRKEFESTLPDETEADRLQLMLEEIDRTDPQPGEDEELAGKQRRGANSRQIMESSGSITQMLTESENSITDQLGEVYRLLCDLERIDPALTGALPGQCYELQNLAVELSNAVSQLPDKVDLDPEALNAIEARLSDIYTLKRRYGPTMELLLEARSRAAAQLDRFNHARSRREEFARQKTRLETELHNVAEALSTHRKKYAVKFLELTAAKLRSIGFFSAGLKAEFTPVPPGSSGMDHLELMFSANPGEELRPLRKIASSGELSRIMLALKTVLADADATPTVIFDEIDMNIGGETANKVGDELCALGSKRQIICISHLAQVAARAHEHFKVEKYTDGDRTCSLLHKLDDPVPELGRMLGGGESALRHAAELVKSVKKDDHNA